MRRKLWLYPITASHCACETSQRPIPKGFVDADRMRSRILALGITHAKLAGRDRDEREPEADQVDGACRRRALTRWCISRARSRTPTRCSAIARNVPAGNRRRYSRYKAGSFASAMDRQNSRSSAASSVATGGRSARMIASVAPRSRRSSSSSG